MDASELDSVAPGTQVPPSRRRLKSAVLPRRTRPHAALRGATPRPVGGTDGREHASGSVHAQASSHRLVARTADTAGQLAATTSTDEMTATFLTLDEAATTLRLHPVTLRALAAAGRVPAVKVGRVWRFLEIDLLAWARANYERADAVGDKENTCRSTNVQIAAAGGPRSPYQTEAAYADLVAPRIARKHRNGSTARVPISGASIDSANAPSTRGRRL